jgi:hypothetical protein
MRIRVRQEEEDNTTDRNSGWRGHAPRKGTAYWNAQAQYLRGQGLREEHNPGRVSMSR